MGSEIILKLRDQVPQLQPADTNQHLRYQARDIPKLDIGQCKAMVIKNFEKCKEDGIDVANLRASLLCPIGKGRIKEPCRSISCTHLQCFDAIVFLKMQQRDGMNMEWLCPVCEKPALFENLRIDSLFKKILRRTVSWYTTVQFEQDGSWAAVASKHNKTVEIDSPDLKNVKIVNPVVDLTNDDSISSDIDVQVLCEKINLSLITDPQDAIQVLSTGKPTLQVIDIIE